MFGYYRIWMGARICSRRETSAFQDRYRFFCVSTGYHSRHRRAHSRNVWWWPLLDPPIDRHVRNLQNVPRSTPDAPMGHKVRIRNGFLRSLREKPRRKAVYSYSHSHIRRKGGKNGSARPAQIWARPWSILTSGRSAWLFHRTMQCKLRVRHLLQPVSGQGFFPFRMEPLSCLQRIWHFERRTKTSSRCILTLEHGI